MVPSIRWKKRENGSRFFFHSNGEDRSRLMVPKEHWARGDTFRQQGKTTRKHPPEGRKTDSALGPRKKKKATLSAAIQKEKKTLCGLRFVSEKGKGGGKCFRRLLIKRREEARFNHLKRKKGPQSPGETTTLTRSQPRRTKCHKKKRKSAVAQEDPPDFPSP